MFVTSLQKSVYQSLFHVLNSLSSEFVLRYQLVSPLLTASIVVGGGMRLHGCICWFHVGAYT